MEYAQVVVKRPLEVDEGNDHGASSACEPLLKAPFVRRPTLRIQPKVPPDRRNLPTVVPWSGTTLKNPGLEGKDHETQSDQNQMMQAVKNRLRKRLSLGGSG
ncbi:hypothetical protein HPB52_025411 [Rhipicephalus sanguineus]|uniref:Uncharacterized protein n=1 Tax=Rhipicephalus sanguineus TaxID=34632 RepID=A0A9D4SMX0_RHISA|nr:hypothetical protein HPB52_025411 [Rhipicephalus sanguineus]